jgi:hypothetical protein
MIRRLRYHLRRVQFTTWFSLMIAGFVVLCIWALAQHGVLTLLFGH